MKIRHSIHLIIWFYMYACLTSQYHELYLYNYAIRFNSVEVLITQQLRVELNSFSFVWFCL